MAKFVLRRLFQSILTVFGVLTAAFVLVRLSGDPTALLLPESASADDIARFRAEFGLDQPYWVQYLKFIGNAAVGDLGISLRQQTSALGLVLDRLPATLELAFAAFAIGTGLALVLGLAIQIVPGRGFRDWVLWLAMVRQSIPTFWFGLLLILLFAVQLRWLPSLGRGSLNHLVLPALTLGTYELALYLRLLDGAFSEQDGQDYVRTAFAKGLSRSRVLVQHMLPNVLLPMVTIAGLNLGVLLGGAIVTETVFGWPGVGRLIVQAVSQRDYPVVIAGTLVTSMIFIAINLVVDVLYSTLDPRVRLA